MNPRLKRLYDGPRRPLAIGLVLAIALGGYFYPLLGLAVPGLMLVALATNAFSRRSFCAGICPNGKSLSIVLAKASPGKPLPRFLSSREFRRALCGFMLFCVVGLVSRSGGALSAVARIFWSIYLISIAISIGAGLLFKPRAWCAFCPMGTLQDTLGSFGSRGGQGGAKKA